MSPRVSVIIATYNRAHLLKTAINSVLSQTYSDYELIIADDGSNDETALLVENYSEDVGRLRYFYQDNAGKSVALNRALTLAKGEWIAFLDSDDYWQPEKLERQFWAIEQFGDRCGACFTDGQFINNPHMDTTLFEFFGRHYDGPIGMLSDPVRTFAQGPAGVSIVTLLCRADLIQEVGAFDPELRFTEDYDFLFRLALKTDFSFVNAPLVIIDRTPAAGRHSGASAIWDEINFRLHCEQRRYEKWMALARASRSDVCAILAKHLQKVHSGWANWYLTQRDYQAAHDEIVKAASYGLSPGIVIKRLMTRLSPQYVRKLALKRGFDVRVF